MQERIAYFCSTVGRKQLVGVTGLLLSLFVLSHALGNFLIFVGPEAYNMYSHLLISNPAIYVAEAGLVVLFVVHLGLAMKLTFENWAARPQGYAVAPKGPKGTSHVTKGMWAQGIIILVFTVLHLIGFKYGTYYEATYDGVVVRDLYRLVLELFESPIYVGGYVFALLVLGVHLSHGFSSAIQSLGFNHPKYTPMIEKLGLGFALLVSLAFISQPLYVFFVHKG